MIKVENLCIDLGALRLKDISLSIGAGEHMILLGPTGVGKSVLLECLVGIYRIKSGRIFINDKDVTDLYPEERNIGYVPQDYAIFPNMSVERNLSYGLRARRLPENIIRERVGHMMDMLGIGHLSRRLPLNLSGGEKQRVALGRALVTRPEILLLDEPFSALDENMSYELAGELKKIHKLTGTTFLHVSHDFEIASYVGDRLAIMDRSGTVVQVGSPYDVLYVPKNEFVARFTRTRNIFKGLSVPDGSGSRIVTVNSLELRSSHSLPGPVTLSIRPENIALMPGKENSQGLNIIKGKVLSLQKRMAYSEIEITAGETFVVYAPQSEDVSKLSSGCDVFISIPADAVNLFGQSL